MAEQAAIIRHVGIGTRGDEEPSLWFDTYASESSVAMQVLSWDKAREILAQVYDVKDLEGRPCWVEISGGMMRFVRLWRKLD